jgi:hypothetical protein
VACGLRAVRGEGSSGWKGARDLPRLSRGICCFFLLGVQMSRTEIVWAVGLAVIGLAALLGGLLIAQLPGGRYFGVAWAMALIAVMSFLGFLVLALSKASKGAPGHTRLGKGDLRGAITASFVIVYLVVLTSTLYYHPAPTVTKTTTFQSGETTMTTTTPGAPPSDVMLRSFTWIMGVIAAFYFGTTAYEASKEKQHEADRDSRPDPADPASEAGASDSMAAPENKGSPIQP